MESEDETPTLDTVKELSGGIAIIALSEIEPNPTQPRTRFSDAQLKELAQSITFKLLLVKGGLKQLN